MNLNNVPSLLFISKTVTLVIGTYTLLRFGGLQPLCGSGVTSSIDEIRNPACCRADIADSRPEPGPLTLISTSRTPLRIAELAQRWAALWAAKGVLLRDPLKPTQPAEPAQTVLPSKSVIVINVLLNDAFMCTIARTTFFLTFRFVFFAITLFSYCVSIPNNRLLAAFLHTLLARNSLTWTLASASIALSTLASNR